MERPINVKTLRYWVGAWLPVFLAIIVIFFESTETFGADNTSHPLRVIFEALFGPVSNARWAVLHILLRKIGHFFGYGTIGLIWLRAWWKTLPHSRYFQDALLGLLGTALVASCDEWHQTYLPNRTGSPWDVLIDCSGAITLQLVVYLILRTFRPKRLRHDE